jgi:hypothetical protein
MWPTPNWTQASAAHPHYQAVARRADSDESRNRRHFSLHRKYKRIPNLVMVYLWNARSAEDVEFYAMPFTKAKRIAAQLGWEQVGVMEGRRKWATKLSNSFAR